MIDDWIDTLRCESFDARLDRLPQSAGDLGEAIRACCSSCLGLCLGERRAHIEGSLEQRLEDGEKRILLQSPDPRTVLIVAEDVLEVCQSLTSLFGVAGMDVFCR